MKLVLATKNCGKQSEFQALLAPYRIEVELMPEGVHVEEDGKTYLENAKKKASVVARLTGKQTVADDSGIEIDALNGEPGVHSARFLNGAPDPKKCARIIELLKGREDRGARFVIALVLADPSDTLFVTHAEVRGRIASETRGKGGFGYDPIFIPDGMTKTMAELSSEEKNTLSHRAQAARALARYFQYRDGMTAVRQFESGGTITPP